MFLIVGATNIRVVALNTKGEIIASKSTPNHTKQDPAHKGGLIWDVDDMWGKLKDACRAVVASIDVSNLVGVTITTFGVDGTFVDKKGKLLHPVISWQCGRTQAIINNMGKYIPVKELYQVSGVYPYAFNTINKLIWLKENKPSVIDNAHKFLFLPSLFINKLTGEIKNDVTMAGTSMLNDIHKRYFSGKILHKIGLDASVFGSLAEPGDQAGLVHQEAYNETGIPVGTPVFFTGHDSQFAIFGSGANLKQPVLSSGTWEVLMARSTQCKSGKDELANKMTTETDVQPGVYNIGQNWLGSGILEWFLNTFSPGKRDASFYGTIISEAQQIKPGSHGLYVTPDFYKDTSNSQAGSISGLTINTSRAEMYLAILESLAFRLYDGLKALEAAGQFKAEKIICVGGGSKNSLWNQLRADVCQLPIQLITHEETTVLGAALFVFKGAGLFKSANEAREQIPYQPSTIKPSNNSSLYQDLYKEWGKQKKN